MKVIFFNIGWMHFYNGMSSKLNDQISGSSKYLKKHGWGHEIFNFKEYSKRYYGFVEARSIKIEKLGASREDDKIDNITVVWTAPHPGGGTYIIGWYINATVYRNYQKLPKELNRFYKNKGVSLYYASCDENNAKLLSVDERVIMVHRSQKGWMGQSPVWYANNNPDFVERVITYIKTGVDPFASSSIPSGNSLPRQNNPQKKAKVEKVAIEVVTKYYRNYDYDVISVEKDNVGWDLEASRGKLSLKIEVKGLSGSECCIQLTPNEYRALMNHRTVYRLCIVNECLTSTPVLKIFSYSDEKLSWVDQDGRELNIEELTGAKAYI